jgi:hypothetical protein
MDREVDDVRFPVLEISLKKGVLTVQQLKFKLSIHLKS